MEAMAQYLAKPWLSHYTKGVPDTIDIPANSLPELFDEACERRPKRPALVFYGRVITYAELRDATDRLANAFLQLGIAKGDRVALYLLNSPQFVMAYFATLKCGATVTPISPVYTSHEVRHQLVDSGARAVVCQDVLFDKVERSGVQPDILVLTNIGEWLPMLKRLFGKSAPVIPAAPNRYRLKELLRQYPPIPAAVSVDPETDVAALPYTGGTTAQPKGVVLTHYNLVAARIANHAALPQLEEGKEVVMAILPFFHIYGQVAIMLNGLVQGSTLVLFTTPDTEAVLTAMERYKATVFFGVPTLYEYLKDHKDTGKVNWRRVKILVSGADTLHESTVEGWKQRTGVDIVEGYGLSETCAASHVNPPDRPKPGSFGVPLPNVLAAVVDPETLAAVPQGDTGELVLSGPNVMCGYLNRPEDNTRVLFERDGHRWLRTGDIVRMDEEGYFHFYDRTKDLIKFKGHSVFARDIEEVLYSHPQVKAAGVIGVADAAVGHRIKAIVVLHSEARGTVSEDDIRAYCTERLASFKVPQIIEFRGELPKTDVGKVSRRELREESTA
jgi:long-chain acyl-CoA synthetase